MRQSTNNNTKSFNERRFAETIGGIGEERGQIIFGNNWARIKELTNVLERINGPVGLAGGTGASLQNAALLKSMIVTSAETAALPLGLAGTHHPIEALVSFGGEWVSLYGLASAITNPVSAERILKVARQVIKYGPYAATAAVAETGGTRQEYRQGKSRGREGQGQDCYAADPPSDVHTLSRMAVSCPVLRQAPSRFGRTSTMPRAVQSSQLEPLCQIQAKNSSR